MGAVECDAAVDGEAETEVDVAADLDVDGLQGDVAGVREACAAEAQARRDRGAGEDDAAFRAEVRVAGEVLAGLDVVGVEGVAARVAQRGAFEVELAGDDGAGEPEAPLDGEVGGQDVAADGEPNRRDGLDARGGDHRVLELPVAVDLGAAEHEGPAQARAGHHEPSVDLCRAGGESGQCAVGEHQVPGPGAPERRRVVEAARGQDDRRRDLGEPQVQGAGDPGAGQTQRRTVARGGPGAVTEQQRRHDLRPYGTVRRGRLVADVHGTAPGEGAPQLALGGVEFVDTHDRRSSRRTPFGTSGFAQRPCASQPTSLAGRRPVAR
ncbi:hypothetical protein [Streptomyces sp. NPDC046939]|uniref:hypothetical protein n=1 Tax=Streptomyces sp. NPDC046939 TaxID=3155376 RepID=UPI0033DA7C06